MFNNFFKKMFFCVYIVNNITTTYSMENFSQNSESEKLNSQSSLQEEVLKIMHNQLALFNLMGQDDALIKEYSKDQLKDLMIKYYVLKCASIGVLLLHANEIKNAIACRRPTQIGSSHLPLNDLSFDPLSFLINETSIRKDKKIAINNLKYNYCYLFFDILQIIIQDKIDKHNEEFNDDMESLKQKALENKKIKSCNDEYIFIVKNLLEEFNQQQFKLQFPFNKEFDINKRLQKIAEKIAHHLDKKPFNLQTTKDTLVVKYNNEKAKEKYTTLINLFLTLTV